MFYDPLLGIGGLKIDSFFSLVWVNNSTLSTLLKDYYFFKTITLLITFSILSCVNNFATFFELLRSYPISLFRVCPASPWPLRLDGTDSRERLCCLPQLHRGH